MGNKSKQIKSNGKKTHKNKEINIKCIKCKDVFSVILSNKEKKLVTSNLCEDCQIVVKEEFLGSVNKEYFCDE